jgi:hypothetical protein
MALLSKTGKDTSTSTQAPWSVQQPYLEKGFEAAEDLWGAPGPAYFPDSGVAGFSPDQIAAQDMIRETAMGGSDVMDAANNYALDVLGGDVNDPYGDSVFQNIQSKVMPAINSQSMMAGRLGSSQYADTMGRALTEAYSPWASQNWQFAQKQKEDMAKFAPELRKMDYFDAGALGLVGKEQQDLAQQERDDAKARWDYYQQMPYRKLSDYMGTVGGTNWGGQSTTTTPVTKPTGLGEIVGTGLSILGGVGDIFGGSIF